MYHDVERRPLPFFLREVSQKKLSGHLYVSAKDFHISLNFLEGRLANGMSTRFDEKLSVILHLMGNIDEEQYNFLSGLHQFSDDQVAGILLDHNFAKKKDIYYARIFQLRRIAISTFALQRGNWIFTAGEPDPPLREVFEIPLAGILVEGARSVDHVAFYANMWQRHIAVFLPEIPQDVEIYFTDAERAFHAAARRLGRLGCQELLARLNMLPNDFWRSLLAFHLLGVVEFERDERAPDISGEIAALLELHQGLQAGRDIRALLGLAPEAGLADFERARAGMLARFGPERFGSAAAPQIKSIARAVCRRLRALAARVKPRPAPPPANLAPEPEMPRGPERTIEPGAADEPQLLSEADMVVEAEAEPHLLGEADMVVEAEVADEPHVLGEADLIEEAHVPLPAAEPPPTELVVEPELNIEVEIEEEEEPAAGAVEISREAGPLASAEPPPMGFAPVAAPPSLRMDTADHEKAWELLLQGKELYERRQFANAVPLLKKAIKLESGQGDFYYLLGLCQSESELTRNEAEINLKKAIELKSWSADPVYALGVLYRGEGKMKLAERCFQRVKEISYEHTGASRALVDLRRQRAGGRYLPPPPKKRRP
jgi:hypothetical protein